MGKCTEERFLKDVKDHSMTVLRDDGADRHLSFTNNGSSTYRFDLITWPGHLCITGDCGTYVFSRVSDMFEFFRPSEFSKEKGLSINTGYWGEKLQSIGTNAGYKEFCADRFEAHILSDFNQWEFEEPKKSAVWNQVKDDVLDYSHDGEIRAIDAAMSFVTEEDETLFQDFYEHECKEYSFHYLWCLYAIVHGISEYDKAA